MNTPQGFVLFSVLALSAQCKTGESGDEQVDPEIAAQIEICEVVCLKPFSCDPALDPAPGVDAECRVECTEIVTAAQTEGCTDRYQDFLECLESLSCDDFYLWSDMGPGAPCTAEEGELELSCPGIEVRNEGG